MKYYRAFDRSGYHSAFFTTYAFSVGAFEDTVLPRLRNARCRNIHVLADEAILNAEFAEFGPPRYAGRFYHLLKINAPGNAAFHPKIALQLGAKSVRLMVGSANLTGPGLAGNLELVTELRCDDASDPLLPIVRQAFDYILGWAGDDPWLNEAANRALEETPLLRGVEPATAADLLGSDGLLSLVSDTVDVALIDQIRALIQDDEISRLIVLSPYWDKELRGLKSVVEAVGNPPTAIFLDQQEHGFPSSALGALEPSFHTLDFQAKSRFLHAKLIIAEGRNADHLVTGSINCSWPALSGLSRQSGNAEAGIYRRLAPGSAVDALGLKTSLEQRLDRSELKPATPAELGDTESKIYATDGGRLIARGGFIYWSHRSQKSPPRLVRLYSEIGELMAQTDALDAVDDDRWRLQLGIAIDECITAELILHDGRASAPVIIEHTERLRGNASAKDRGGVGKTITRLRDMPDEGLDILEALDLFNNAEVRESPADLPETSTLAKAQDDEAAPEGKRLSYADFVRTKPAQSGSHARLSLVAGRPIEEVPRALNRFIGLMVHDKDEAADEELLNEAFDLSPKESGMSQDDVLEGDQDAAGEAAAVNIEPSRQQDQDVEKERERRQRNKLMAAQLVSAVEAFEVRLKELKEVEMKPVDLIRLRALIQIICAFGTSIGAEASDARPLPVWSEEANGWPRLIGRVVFGVMRLGTSPFGHLQLENELARTPDEIIEAWGACRWGVYAALYASSQVPEAKGLLPMLIKLDEHLRQCIKDELGDRSPDSDAVVAFANRFGERFEERLGVAANTRNKS
ncbi:hypothetical protein L5876_07515 [Hyphobacterium sp. SN044]|uniref:hypothetical protein n=1 Tax=Hyphobacterium sp. SN044 TaxID=2912575 RepID=UPI001F15BBEB|nr:hypothetical protein [Hyphobacterium sp. SN044]MCF8879656.1 hypothetical protein [Hyphobacterium sp. SN044]